MVTVERSRHIDADEDAGYRYEYDLYRFSDGEISFVARSYVRNPKEAHFLRVEIGGKSRMLSDHDLNSPLFRESVSHLRSLGKNDLQWLSGQGDGYEAVKVET